MTYRVRAVRRTPGGRELTSTERHILLLLATRFNAKEQHAFPSVDTLALDAGMERRSVQRVLRRLKDDRCIRVEYRPHLTRGGNASSSYVFMPEFLEGAFLVTNKDGTGETWQGLEPTQPRSKPTGNRVPFADRKPKEESTVDTPRRGEDGNGSSNTTMNQECSQDESGVPSASTVECSQDESGVPSASTVDTSELEPRSEASKVTEKRGSLEVGTAAPSVSVKTRKPRLIPDSMYASFFQREMQREATPEEIRLVREISDINKDALGCALFLAKLKADEDEQRRVLGAFIQNPGEGFTIYDELMPGARS